MASLCPRRHGRFSFKSTKRKKKNLAAFEGHNTKARKLRFHGYTSQHSTASCWWKKILWVSLVFCVWEWQKSHKRSDDKTVVFCFFFVMSKCKSCKWKLKSGTATLPPSGFNEEHLCVCVPEQIWLFYRHRYSNSELLEISPSPPAALISISHSTLTHSKCFGLEANHQEMTGPNESSESSLTTTQMSASVFQNYLGLGGIDHVIKAESRCSWLNVFWKWSWGQTHLVYIQSRHRK